jgi:hypothetical protein
MFWLAAFRLSAATITLGLLLACAAPDEPALEVRILDQDGSRVVGAMPLDASREFTLSFTHSMYGGTVTETYEVLWDPTPQLRRTAVRTQHGGAAEYYARYGNFFQDGDGWIVDVPPLTLPSLQMRVDSIGQPELDSRRDRLALLSLVPDGSLVEIRAVVASRGIQ